MTSVKSFKFCCSDIWHKLILSEKYIQSKKFNIKLIRKVI